MFKSFVCLTSLILTLTMINSIRAELIGHWTLDETSGTIAADTSGRGHNGTYVDNPDLSILGVRGTGMDASGGYMEVDLGDDLPIQAEERTIALWLNTPETQLAKIKFINKYIYNPDRVVFRNVVIQTFGK